jgi:hypothetical protein
MKLPEIASILRMSLKDVSYLRDQGALRGRLAYHRHEYTVEDAYRICLADTLRSLGYSVKSAVGLTNKVGSWPKPKPEGDDYLFISKAEKEGVEIATTTINISRIVGLVDQLIEMEQHPQG